LRASVDQTEVGNAPAQGIAGMDMTTQTGRAMSALVTMLSKLKREVLFRAGSRRDYSAPQAGTDRLDG
jgi:hypothetical protein